MKKVNMFYCILAMLIVVSGCVEIEGAAGEVQDRHKTTIKSGKIMADSWEEFDWDNAPDALASNQIRHEAPEDVRKRIWLNGVGKYATQSKTVREAATLGEEDPNLLRYALAWEDILLPYPVSDLVYETAGPFPTNCDSNTKLPGVNPGSVICWFERIFSHSIQGVIKTGEDYEFKFSKTNVTKYGIYTENGCTVDIDGTQESWTEEEDDFRPGTPFAVTGSPESENDGFYRVKSVTTDALFTYVRVDNNNYEQQDLIVSGSGGTAECDFGGAWYQFVGMEGNSNSSYNTAGGDMTDYLGTLDDSVYNASINKNWWTPKDQYHRYEETGGNVTYGPNDGRPPTGGMESKDFNGNWIRTSNPSVYHTYDDNAHRWIVKSETEGSHSAATYVQYTSIVPSSVFLSAQFDPREIVSPFRFDDTDTNKWKYGSKVKFTNEQLTDPTELGAINSVVRTGYVTTVPSYVGQSSHSQYQTIHLIDPPGAASGNRTVLGDFPPVSDNHPKVSWLNQKYNKSLQNAIEQVIESTPWQEAPNDTFKNNWIDVYGNAGIIQIDVSDWTAWDSGTTYSINDEVKAGLQVYVSLQNNNTNHAVTDTAWWKKYSFKMARSDYDIATAWQPNLNPDQPFFADAGDEMFGENGSRFEYFIAKTGNFDWYYDDTYAFQSQRSMDDAWEWWLTTGVGSHSLPGTYNGVACTTAEDVKNAYWRVPVGTWRKTWRYSLGKPQDNPMKDGDETAPATESYESVSALPPDFVSTQGDYSGSDNNNDDCFMFGHHRMTDPGEIADDTEIAGRHEEAYTVNGHKIYTANIFNILKQCRTVLRGLSRGSDSTTIDLVWEVIDPGDDAVAPQSTEEAYRAALDVYTLASWASPSTFTDPGSNPLVGSSPYYFDNLGIWSNPTIGEAQANAVAIKLTASSASIVQLLSGGTGDGRILSVSVSATAVPASGYFDANGDENKFHRTPGIKGIGDGDTDIRCIVDDTAFYGLGRLNIDDATEIVYDAGTYEYYFLIYPLKNSNQIWVSETDEGGGIYESNNLARIALQSAERIVIAFDWDGFSDAIWNRDEYYERADYRLNEF